jgi:SAM-dependent methyltransferase
MFVFPAPPLTAVDPTSDVHPAIFYSAYAAWKARWVRSCCPRGRLLEIGCGDGFFLAAAKAIGYEVAGVEPHPGRARRAAEALNIEVRCSLLEDLHWPGARFDVVYHCDLLSHFPDPIAALRKMSALLAPGGMLAFEVGTMGGLRRFWYEWIGSLGYPQHRWLYSEASVRQLLACADLGIEAWRHFGLAPCVLLDRCRDVAASGVHALRRAGRSIRAKAAVTPANQADAAAEAGPRQRIAALYQRADQFVRYRIGAVAPRIGPGTVWIAARPLSVSREARAGV